MAAEETAAGGAAGGEAAAAAGEALAGGEAAAAAAGGAATEAAGTGGRSASLFFQGSLSTATRVRGHLAQLRALPGARIVDVPRGGVQPNASAPAGESCSRAEPCATKLAFARRMLCSDFCLTPKGDTPTSSRFYSAIACGCVPLVVSDDLRHHLPFPQRVNYSFVQYVRERDFLRDPTGAVDATMQRLQPQLPALREQMREAARELLFEEEGSRVAHNALLEYAGDCAPAPLPGE